MAFNNPGMLSSIETGSLLYNGSQNFSKVYKNFTLSLASLAKSVIFLSSSRQA